MYDSDNYLVLDFEIDTSHGDYGHPVHEDNKMLLACWKRGDQTKTYESGLKMTLHSQVQSKWGGEYDMEPLLEEIESVDFIVAHNAKYELGWLRRCGLDLSGVLVFDTQIAEYVLMGNLSAGDEAMAPRSTSLDACCIRRGWRPKDPVVDTMMSHGINPVEMPRSWLEGRCRQDVESTEKLFKAQRRSLRNTSRLGCLQTRCQITPILAAMEAEGLKLDAERVNQEYEKHVRDYADLNRRMEEFTGGINWRSSKQVAAFLYNSPDNAESPGLGFRELTNAGGEARTTPGGAPRTDDKTLEALTATTKRQRDFLILRRALGTVNAALTKNLQFFQGVCKNQNGIFHATYNQTSTATHRLSSSGIPIEFEGKKKSVQIQNLPNAFKPVFRARKDGWIIAEADGSQLEFRVAGQLSRDAQMVEDILDPGFDAHIASASAMYSVAYDELYKRFMDGDNDARKLRKKAKAETFGPLYGKSTGTKEQLRWIKAFRQRYNQFYAWSEKNAHTVVAEKRLICPWGLRFYWPYAKMSNRGYINVSTKTYNYPIQSFATAEIIPIALHAFNNRVERANLGKDIRLVNTVHDSIICEINQSVIEEWKDVSLEAFTTDVYKYLEEVYNYDFDLVPLGVGLCYGTHWADESNVEQEFNVFRDGTRGAKAA